MYKRALCLICCLVLCAVAGADITRFIVCGDSRGGDNGVDSAILGELVTAIKAEHADLVVFTGDLVSDGTLPQLQYFGQVFIDPLRAAGIPVYPCRGNHDSSVIAWNAMFTGVYALPQNGPPDQLNLTYWFAYNDVFFVSLEENIWNPEAPVDQEWLNAQLAQNTRPHVFVFGHYPIYAVNHQDCLALCPTPRDEFVKSLVEAHARVYFTGHDHFYDDAEVPAFLGVPFRQMVAGSAGAPLYDWSGTYTDPRVTGIAHVKSFGYMVVDIDGLNVQMVFKQRNPNPPNDYVAADSFSYVGPGPNLPAFGMLGVILASVCVAMVYVVRRYARARYD